MHPFDLTLAAQGVGEPIQAIADDAVNPLHAGCDEYFHKLICYISWHQYLLPIESPGFAERGGIPFTAAYLISLPAQ
jgi:hypothetical protein